ncbi:MAG: hypothetical protein KDK70_12320 [Myxococcales bacterium]|nr:hypothetical protein [Myxococcales bacterium]
MTRTTRVLVGLWAVVELGCTGPKPSDSTPPDAAAGASGSAASGDGSSPQCLPGGPSVSVNVRRPSGDPSLSRDELGALLAWVGGFVQPCIDAPSQAHHITLVFELGAEGEPPTYELVERETLPTMAACLDEGFAKAPAPPPEAMRASIVVPWGCPTLGPGFVSREPTPAAEAAPANEPGEPAPATEWAHKPKSAPKSQ